MRFPDIFWKLPRAGALSRVPDRYLKYFRFIPAT